MMNDGFLSAAVLILFLNDGRSITFPGLGLLDDRLRAQGSFGEGAASCFGDAMVAIALTIAAASKYLRILFSF
ncbi:hypothetical protein ACVWXO_001914 [Bradyrhizobium sp. LM2.7]